MRLDVVSGGQTMWAVVRTGAYMHYAVPRIIHRAGRLDRLYTDFYAGDAGSGLLSRLPKALRSAAISRALARSTADLPRDRVRSYPLFGLEYYARQLGARGSEAKSAVYLHANHKFGRMVSRNGFGNAGAIYTFNTAAFEVLQAAKQRQMFTVVEQTIAPRGLEEDLLAEENQRFPGWESARHRGPSTEATIKRESEEWALADLILCASEFVRQGVAYCGGPLEKCVVVPYGVDERFLCPQRRPHDGSLRVLSVGDASLRKGVGYAYETAKLLGNRAELRWVGPIGLEPPARALVERNVHLTGSVPRSQILPHFEWADVFFLPSMCEGSATVTYEALMSGLPVIVTPNVGSVVVDDVNGFIVPARDVEAMSDRLNRLVADPALLLRMQQAALDSRNVASLEAYAQRLLRALSINGSLRRGTEPALLAS
jgi:hypothetical protein